MDSSYHHLDHTEAHLPPGFRFHPTDEELITYYLLKKVLDSTFTGRAIAEVDLNKSEPWELPEKAKMGEKECYATCINAYCYCWCCTNTNHCDLMKDEWVISRVFQKSNTSNGGSAMSASSGSKKTRMNTTNSSLCPEPSSPSSVYLPPLLDSSPYANTTTAVNFTGRNNCSYDSTTKKEHVSCFSTIAAATAAVVSPNNFTNASFDLPPSQSLGTDPFARFQRNVGVSAFPSLRSLQDNLQLPFFFLQQHSPSPAVAPVISSGRCRRSKGWLMRHPTFHWGCRSLIVCGDTS
ncbi:hypothetical protein ACSQ67_010259 [Phaseolus vulgaris]